MNVKYVYIVISCLLMWCAFAGAVTAKSCSAMQKELAELRAEYQDYATVEGPKREGVKFDKLVEILDKIIELKRTMTAAQCPIPPRKRSAEPKR